MDWRIGNRLADWQWIGGLVMGLWNGPGLISDWQWIGRLAMDWQIGNGLAMDWRIGDGFPDGLGLTLHWWISDGFTDWSRIGIGLADWSWICTELEDWRCIGFLCFVAVALTAWEIIHRGDTSVGPHRILVPRLCAELSSDRHIIGMICVNAWQCPANR